MNTPMTHQPVLQVRRRTSDGDTIIELEGKLDSSLPAELREEALSLVEPGCRLVLDLTELKEISPTLTRAALVASPKAAPYDYFLHAAVALAPSLAIEVVPIRLENAADIERAIASFANAPNGGLVLPPDATTTAHRDLVIALAARYRSPAVYSTRAFVEDGGLMSYGADQVEMFRQAAGYIDRILRGAKPADLPVQVPIKYETFLNLKTAKTLGLTVPSGLLVAADKVIE